MLASDGSSAGRMCSVRRMRGCVAALSGTFEEYVGARGPVLPRFAAALAGVRGLAENVLQEVSSRHLHLARIGADRGSARLGQTDDRERACHGRRTLHGTGCTLAI